MNKFNYRVIFSVIVLLFNLVVVKNCYSNNLPKHLSVPGGIAIIPLDIHSISLPIVFFNDKRVIVIKYNNYDKINHTENPNNHTNWLAIVGIPMSTTPGLHKISIFLDQKDQNHFSNNIEKSFFVSHSKYPAEKLKLSPHFVTPSLGEQMRINKENELIKNAYNRWSQSIPSLTLKQPISGRKSSPFGLKRILNGQHKGFHSGLDLAAPTGTKVYASAHGQVILTGDFFYTGRVVFIDHGQGLITNYSHLDTIAVKEGDSVDPKTIVGTVGATGRVTGPHLHWSVSLNDARINPELFEYTNRNY